MARNFSFEESEALSCLRFPWISDQSVKPGQLVLELSPRGFPAFSETEEASGFDWGKSGLCVKFVGAELGKAGPPSELIPVSCICAEDACSVLAPPEPGAGTGICAASIGWSVP